LELAEDASGQLARRPRGAGIWVEFEKLGEAQQKELLRRYRVGTYLLDPRLKPWATQKQVQRRLQILFLPLQHL
jgi:hypothetical protein